MKVVDLFAGAGGWTTGARQAGLTVVAAANHWKLAVESHQTNHPDTHHICQDLNLLDPSTLPPHDIVLASPECKGHARARGKPWATPAAHDKSRATAWCVIDVVEVTRPRVVVVENVPEFRSWALYSLWREALIRLGYKLTEQVLDAAEFGVPQNRERLIVVGHRHRAIHVRSPCLEPVPARSFLRFDDSVKWSPVKGHAPATLARVKRGRRELGERFLAPYYSSGSGLTGRSIDRPIGTVTTLDRYLLVDGKRCRCLTVDEYRAAMSFPEGYQLAGTRRDRIIQLGNAMPPKLALGVLEQIAEAA